MRLGSRLVEPIAIAGNRDSPAAETKMLCDMVGRQKAIAVGEEQVGRLADMHPFISALGKTKAVVGVGREFYGEIRPPSQSG